MCVWETGRGQGAWLNESPTGGNEQAAANHISHAHATNDDWRRGDEGRGELSLKGTGGLFFWDRGECAADGGERDMVKRKEKEAEEKMDEVKKKTSSHVTEQRAYFVLKPPTS